MPPLLTAWRCSWDHRSATKNSKSCGKQDTHHAVIGVSHGSLANTWNTVHIITERATCSGYRDRTATCIHALDSNRPPHLEIKWQHIAERTNERVT